MGEKAKVKNCTSYQETQLNEIKKRINQKKTIISKQQYLAYFDAAISRTPLISKEDHDLLLIERGISLTDKEEPCRQ